MTEKIPGVNGDSKVAHFHRHPVGDHFLVALHPVRCEASMVDATTTCGVVAWLMSAMVVNQAWFMGCTICSVVAWLTSEMVTLSTHNQWTAIMVGGL